TCAWRWTRAPDSSPRTRRSRSRRPWRPGRDERRSRPDRQPQQGLPLGLPPEGGPDPEHRPWRVPVTRMQLPLGRPDLLFHRAEDPLQERDLWDAEPGKRREMLDKLRALLDEEGCPEEGYVRLGLSA